MTNTNSFQNWVEIFAGWVCRLLRPLQVSAGGCEQAPGFPEGAESTDSVFTESAFLVEVERLFSYFGLT